MFMKKKILYVLFLLLVVVHFMLLYYFGIASFTDTILLYALIYLFTQVIARFFKNVYRKELFTRNIQTLLILLLIFEFLLTFVFKQNTNYFESEYGIYLSEYKRDAQLKLIHFLGRKNASIAWEHGYVPYTERKHVSQDFNYKFTVNQLGLRGKLPPLEKDSNEYRICILGDSFIEGYGAENDSMTFSEQLKKQLQNSSKKINTINAGICGSNPIYEINLYNNKLRSYNNDLILLQINLTDLQDIEYAYHQDKMPLSEYFNASSHLFRIFYSEIFGYNFTLKRSNNYIIKRKKEILRLLIQQLKEFEQSLSKEHTKLILIYLPLISEITNNESIGEHTDVLENTLKSSGIPLINLKTAYRKTFDGKTLLIDQFYWKQDKHHNARGYKLMATKVTEQLNAMNIIQYSRK